MPKHTQGPWTYYEIVEGYVIETDSFENEIAFIEYKANKSISSVNEIFYNARLIAAAPELLEALEMLCTGLEWNIENNATVMHEADAEALQNARAVIAKAKGGT